MFRCGLLLLYNYVLLISTENSLFIQFWNISELCMITSCCSEFKTLLLKPHSAPLIPANAAPVTDLLPCQRRAAHSPCTPPIRRTGSIPSCVCSCAGPPRGLDQSAGTSPDPQSWDSAPSSPSPARETGAPGEPGLCICLSSATPSSGPPPKKHRGQKSSDRLKKDSKAEMSKPSGFYPHSPDPVFSPERKSSQTRRRAHGSGKSQALHFAVLFLFFS